jgi:hypothetical protein
MTPEELQKFLDRLDLYGGQIESWPPQERADAQSLLQISAEARAQLSAMKRVEAALAASQSNSSLTSDAIAQRAMLARQDRPGAIAMRRMSWALAGTLALVAGFYVGTLHGAYETPGDAVAAALDQGGHDVW